MSSSTNYACPCCGYLTLDEKSSGTFDDPDFAGGANVVSLNTARENFKKFHASEERWLSAVRPPLPEEIPSGSN